MVTKYSKILVLFFCTVLLSSFSFGQSLIEAYMTYTTDSSFAKIRIATFDNSYDDVYLVTYARKFNNSSKIPFGPPNIGGASVAHYDENLTLVEFYNHSIPYLNDPQYQDDIFPQQAQTGKGFILQQGNQSFMLDTIYGRRKCLSLIAIDLDGSDSTFAYNYIDSCIAINSNRLLSAKHASGDLTTIYNIPPSNAKLYRVNDNLSLNSITDLSYFDHLPAYSRFDEKIYFLDGDDHLKVINTDNSVSTVCTLETTIDLPKVQTSDDFAYVYGSNNGSATISKHEKNTGTLDETITVPLNLHTLYISNDQSKVIGLFYSNTSSTTSFSMKLIKYDESLNPLDSLEFGLSDAKPKRFYIDEDESVIFIAGLVDTDFKFSSKQKNKAFLVRINLQGFVNGASNLSTPPVDIKKSRKQLFFDIKEH